MERSSEEMPGFDRVWDMVLERQGKEFHTAKGLAFRYTVRGGEMFVDRRSKSITRATVEKAYEKLKADVDHEIQGPKKLCVFGAPYVWAVFSGLGLLDGRESRKAEE